MLGAGSENSLEAVGDLLELVLLLAVRNVNLGKLGASDNAVPDYNTVLGLQKRMSEPLRSDASVGREDLKPRTYLGVE